MTLWHASTDLRLTAAGLAAATVAESLREAEKAVKVGTAREAGRKLGRVAGLGLGVDYRDTGG